MKFLKMQSLGNDFVVFGSPSQQKMPCKQDISKICNRKYGVGADCAVFISKSEKADYFMHVYNPDGFEAEICGNALRCSAKYVTECGYYSRQNLFAETKSGIKKLSFDNDFITAEIGTPKIIAKDKINISGISLPYTYISMGNPHCVVFIHYGLSDEEFNHFGYTLETHPTFPNGTNVEFACVTDSNKIVMRVWERGIGETLSCSTGSCACVTAAQSEGLCGNDVQVYQPGGIIKVVTINDVMYTHCKCETVFKGNITL